MRFYSTTTTFEDPWETVTAAFWRKYHRGNPYVSHVEGVCGGRGGGGRHTLPKVYPRPVADWDGRCVGQQRTM